MSKYTTKAGDTFDTISRVSYGEESGASVIKSANPGAVEPFTDGVVLTIPVLPDAPKNRPQATAVDDPDETIIKIDSKRFRFWESVTITRQLDSFSTFELVAPFTPDDPSFRETFRPFKFQDVEISVGGQPLFTGTMIGVMPVLAPDKKTVAVSGYAFPGVLNDCTPLAPNDAYQLEFEDMNVVDITDHLCSPFGVGAIAGEGAPGARFSRVSIAPERKMLDFLADLARQRGLVISDTPQGNLLYQKAISGIPDPFAEFVEGPNTDTSSPVATLRQGESPLIGVSPVFSPQGYYSHVTGLEPVLLGLQGSQYTVENQHLKNLARPHNFIVSDTQGGDVADAVNAKAGRMFANMAVYTVGVSTWRDSSGALWSPNTVITVDAPGAMIYGRHPFIVRAVSFKRTGTEKRAVLTLILPGSLSGKIPETLPWD